MVLKVGQYYLGNSGSEPLTLAQLYSGFPDLASNGAKFASIPYRSVQGSDGVMYVRQKEDVVTYHGDLFDDGNSVKKLGTQDVLTCHVVVLRHEVCSILAKIKERVKFNVGMKQKMMKMNSCFSVIIIEIK